MGLGRFNESPSVLVLSPVLGPRLLPNPTVSGPPILGSDRPGTCDDRESEGQCDPQVQPPALTSVCGMGDVTGERVAFGQKRDLARALTVKLLRRAGFPHKRLLPLPRQAIVPFQTMLRTHCAPKIPRDCLHRIEACGGLSVADHPAKPPTFLGWNIRSTGVRCALTN